MHGCFNIALKNIFHKFWREINIKVTQIIDSKKVDKALLDIFYHFKLSI